MVNSIVQHLTSFMVKVMANNLNHLRTPPSNVDDLMSFNYYFVLFCHF